MNQNNKQRPPITGFQVLFIWAFVIGVNCLLGGMGIATPIMMLAALWQTAPYFLSL